MYNNFFSRFFSKIVFLVVCFSSFLINVNIINAATAELLTSSTLSSWTASNAPYSTYYMDSRMQSIYLKSDLETAGITGSSEITDLTK